MDLGLSGKKALITGGSRGIGRAIASRLLDEGASVAISARGQEGVDEAVAALGSKGTVIGAAVDVADGDALAAWVEDMGNQLGGIDIIVSNASGGGQGTSAKDFQSVLDVDVLGLVRMVEAATPKLKESGEAAVIAISTTAALENFGPGTSAYNAMKAAVINYIGGLAQNLASKGIRANAISPGPIMIEGGSWDFIKENMTPFYDSTLAVQPQGRMGTAEEVANVAAFLASPAASWINGENIVVDGGFTKRVAVLMAKLGLSADEVLTTTRAVRKRIDFDRAVERDVVMECVEIAHQAPTGSNTQGWRWMFVDDPDKKAAIADLYRKNFYPYIGITDDSLAFSPSDDTDDQGNRIRSSAYYMAQRLHEIPLMAIPCHTGRLEGADTFGQASSWGSILPAVWSFLLALRERGIGSSWTTLHLPNEREVADLLGIDYDRYTQVGMFPIGYTKGTEFKPADRAPAERFVHWNTW